MHAGQQVWSVPAHGCMAWCSSFMTRTAPIKTCSMFINADVVKSLPTPVAAGAQTGTAGSHATSKKGLPG
jgi:hypothetical protein